MVNTRSLFRAFSGGEMSPTMAGRIDDPRVQTGAELVRNLLVTPHGPLIRRPGFSRVAAEYGAANQGSRLMRFRYSGSDAAVVEIGHDNTVGGYIRFHKAGAQITFDSAGVADFFAQRDCLVYSITAGAYEVAYIVPFSVSTVNADIDTGTEEFTATGHGFQTGDPIGVVSTGNYPTAATTINSTVVFYAIRVDADHFKIATTEANALAGTAINITAVPAGTPTLYWARADLMTTGDTFRLSGSLPAPLETTRTYYAVPIGSIGYEVWLEPGETPGDDAVLDAPLAFPGTSLSGGWHRRYLHGELAANGGNIYTCKTEHSAAAAFSSTQWLQQGADEGYVISAPWSADALFEIGRAQSLDVLTLTHVDYAARELVRYTDTRWELRTQSSEAKIRAPEGVAVVGTLGFVVPILAINAPAGPLIGSTFSTEQEIAHNLGAPGDGVLVKGTAGVTDGIYTLARITGPSNEADQFMLNDEDGLAVVGTAGAATGTASPVPLGSLESNSYKVTAVDSRGNESLPSDAVTEAENNLYITGGFNTITWNPVGGAVEYRVYKQKNNRYGYIGSVEATEALEFRDDNIAPDMGVRIPYDDDSLAGTDYPATVGYFQQRRWFGGTALHPQGVWGTVIGTESSMQYHLPVVDTDRIRFEVAEREAETIRHIVGGDQLMVFTDQTEYRITPANSDVLTPTNVDIRAASRIGSSHVDPIYVGRSVLFVGNRGGHVYEFSYQADQIGGSPPDLSVRATHLFDASTLVDSASMQAPWPIQFWTSESGQLLALTFLPEQQVAGWQVLENDRFLFESVCVIPEGTEDRLYALVNRDGVRSVQRMGTILEAQELEDMVFVDDAVTGTTDADGVLSGLEHLAGETVHCLAGGVVQEAMDVAADGLFETNQASATATAGLPYISTLKTMPLALQMEGFGQGRPKAINQVWVRVHESCVFQVGPTDLALVPSSAAVPVETVISGEVQVVVLGAWSYGAQVIVQQENPLPLTVLGMTMEVSIGG